MPPRKFEKKAPVPGCCSGIDALPDAVLEHILGFLPAPEAVRTCVLARRWQHLWKSATGLHIMCVRQCNAEGRTFTKQSPQFVDHLLDERGRVPLETCKLSFGGLQGNDDKLRLNRWIKIVVMCQVQMLRLDNVYHDGFELDDLPLQSRHLKRLDLAGAMLNNNFCNLSSCPSLEHLEFNKCYFWSTNKISSKSLKYLSIQDSITCMGSHTLIYAPNLVSLRLDEHWCKTPVFETVPSLQEAFLRVTDECYDCCSEGVPAHCDVEDCFSCYDIEHDNNKCLLLEGLSEVVNLSMIAESKEFILKRGLKQWPTFSKLKTLLLNDYWCLGPKFYTLTYILKHSPVLEKLTLQLFSKEPEHKVEIVGRCSPMERSPVISEHLKEIEIKCEAIDAKLHNLLQFLCTFNISFIFK